MRLGTRWPVGGTPPSGLPAALTDGLAAAEADLAADGPAPTGWAWTLTWLEGAPVATLDDGTTVTEQGIRPAS